MAMGSASELEYHLLLSKDLNYLKTDAYERMQPRVEEVKRMLAALIRR
jgi:four helix bundle protein